MIHGRIGQRMLHIFAFSMLVHAPLISPVRMLKTVVVISTVFDIGCQVHIMATVCAHRRNKLFTVLKCSAMRPKWTNLCRAALGLGSLGFTEVQDKECETA